MKCRLVVAGTLFLAACTPMAPAFVVTPEKSQQFDRDQYQCQYDSRQLPEGPCARIDNYRQCMRAKGWAEQPHTAKLVMCGVPP